jgi:CTP synthase
VELIELKGHPFFTACQYHPEFLSRPGKPHPLFRGLIAAAQQRLPSSPQEVLQAATRSLQAEPLPVDLG